MPPGTRNYSCTNSDTSISLVNAWRSRCSTSGRASVVVTFRTATKSTRGHTPLSGSVASDNSSAKDGSVVKHTATSVVTIDRFIIEQERLHTEATGELSGILY